MNSTPQPECLTYLDADCDEQLCTRTQLDYSCMSAMTASAQLIKYACEHLGLASMVCLNQMHYTPRKKAFLKHQITGEHIPQELINHMFGMHDSNFMRTQQSIFLHRKESNIYSYPLPPVSAPFQLHSHKSVTLRIICILTDPKLAL